METYHGYVRTPADAIKLFEACRLGLLPRVQRRLSEKERQSIRSGSVFVWDEREAGMRRWTDGKSWSASRVSGSFLTYREMEGKRGSGFGNSRRSNGRTPDSGRMSDEDADGEPEGYRYKADGLMKQSFSITTAQGQHLHLISYYSRPHPGAPDLPHPSTDPQLRHITPAKGMYPESSLHDSNPPALTRTPMQPYSNPSPPEQPPYGYAWGAASTPSWMGSWPPSPNATPPWMHQPRTSPDLRTQPLVRPPSRPHAPPQIAQMPPMSLISPMPPMRVPLQPLQQQTAPQLPPPTSIPGGQPSIYSKNAHQFENERLPPPPIERAYQPHSSSPSLSPRLQQLQAQAQAAAHVVMIDPRLSTTSARNPQGPLPALAPTSRGLTPPRTHSVSPPHSISSESVNPSTRASLSALLLHSTPSNSESNSANSASINSASSSPRTLTAVAAGLPPADSMMREDQRAVSALNRKFCI